MTGPSHVSSILIEAPRERVWKELATPGTRQRFWFDAVFAGRVEKGGKVTWKSVDGRFLFIEGEVLECTPPERLVLSFRFPRVGEPFSRVTFTLAAEGRATRVTLTHDQLEKSPKTARMVTKGWPFILKNLRRWIERGSIALPVRMVYALLAFRRRFWRADPEARSA